MGPTVTPIVTLFLLHHLRPLGERLDRELSMILQEPLEVGTDMRRRYVDVIPLRNRRRAMPHQTRQTEPVHAALCTARAKGVAPAIERERPEIGSLDRPIMGVLD